MRILENKDLNSIGIIEKKMIMLFNELEEKFPETKFVSITQRAETPNK
jgi:hypothetical protein